MLVATFVICWSLSTKCLSCSGSKPFDPLRVLPKEFFEKVNFENVRRLLKRHEKLPSMQQVKRIQWLLKDHLETRQQLSSLWRIMNYTHSPDKHHFWYKIVNIFISISFNICFGCSKEPSHREGSFEYPQHMFWLKFSFMHFYMEDKSRHCKPSNRMQPSFIAIFYVYKQYGFDELQGHIDCWHEPSLVLLIHYKMEIIPLTSLSF